MYSCNNYFRPSGLTLSRGALRTKSDQCLGIISARTTGSAPDSSATCGVVWLCGSSSQIECDYLRKSRHWLGRRLASSTGPAPLTSAFCNDVVVNDSSGSGRTQQTTRMEATRWQAIERVHEIWNDGSTQGLSDRIDTGDRGAANTAPKQSDAPRG